MYKVLMTNEKTCTTCLHFKVPYFKEPCVTCIATQVPPKWTPAEVVEIPSTILDGEKILKSTH
jgi:hypothetical protein